MTKSNKTTDKPELRCSYQTEGFPLRAEDHKTRKTNKHTGQKETNKAVNCMIMKKCPMELRLLWCSFSVAGVKNPRTFLTINNNNNNNNDS